MALSTRLVRRVQRPSTSALSPWPTAQHSAPSPFPEIPLGSISELRVVLVVRYPLRRGDLPDPRYRRSGSSRSTTCTRVCRAAVERGTGRDGNSSFRNQPPQGSPEGAQARGAGLWTVGYAATLDDPLCATVHQAGRWSPEVLREPLRRSRELRGAPSRRSPERAPGFITLLAK